MLRSCLWSGRSWGGGRSGKVWWWEATSSVLLNLQLRPQSLYSMSRPGEQDRNQEATCYVGNLDDACTDSLLWELMIQAGPLANLHLPKDRITSNHQGFAFAEFLTEEDSNYACQILNGIKLFGKPLRVNKATAGNDRKVLDVGANLFIGNLDSGVDERLLWESFSQFGTLMGMPKVSKLRGSKLEKGKASAKRHGLSWSMVG